MNESDNQSNNTTERPWLWKKGQSGNLAGRPKGKTMKEYVKDYLSRMTDEERDEFLHGIPKDIIWKMSEGNPETKTDVTSGGKPIPILGNVPINNNNQEDIKSEEKN
jgi:hypothetical protein